MTVFLREKTEPAIGTLAIVQYPTAEIQETYFC